MQGTDETSIWLFCFILWRMLSLSMHKSCMCVSSISMPDADIMSNIFLQFEEYLLNNNTEYWGSILVKMFSILNNIWGK
jgi:hypothetical protein